MWKSYQIIRITRRDKKLANEVTKLIIETILGLITTAFAFVAGLAWSDAIQKLIETCIGTGDALPSLFTYAITVTIVAVVVTVLIARVAAKMGVDIDE